MGHLAGDEVGSALTVTGVLRAHVLCNGGQGRHKGMVILVFLADLRVAGKAGGHDDEGIIRGGVQIHAHLVVGAGHHGLEGLFQQDRGHRRVGGVEGQHGGHVGGDHAAALADGTHGAHLAAQLKLDGVLLFMGIGGHDGVGSLGAVLLGKLCGNDLADALKHLVDRKSLADDAGGADEHFVLAEAEQLFRLALNGAGVFDALLAGGGVGVAGVDDDGAGLALFQDLAVKDDRSCAELVRGEAGRAGAGQVGVENSDVGLLVLALFDGGVDRTGGEALRRGNAALDLFQIGHVGGSPLFTLV